MFNPGWVGLSVVSALRMDRIGTFPSELVYTADNKTDPVRFVSRSALDTYLAATWVASLTTLLFGVFKCRLDRGKETFKILIDSIT